MDNNNFLTAEALAKLREDLSDAWAGQIPRDIEEGWSVSSVDFAEVIAVCPPLQLKAGWKLQAYQYVMGRNGHALLFAVPEEQTLPEPANPEDNNAPLIPVFASSNFMEIVQGDGSPYSYMVASIFAREMSEFGKFGHGGNWIAYHILEDDPWQNSFEVRVGSDMSMDESEWTLRVPKPSSWKPSVMVNPEAIITRFYTFCGLGMQKIVSYTDTYIAGNYQPQIGSEVIATGPRGYVW